MQKNQQNAVDKGERSCYDSEAVLKGQRREAQGIAPWKPMQTPKDRLTSTGGTWYNNTHIPARTLKIKQH